MLKSAKKILAVLVVASMLLSFMSACKKAENSNQKSSTSTGPKISVTASKSSQNTATNKPAGSTGNAASATSGTQANLTSGAEGGDINGTQNGEISSGQQGGSDSQSDVSGQGSPSEEIFDLKGRTVVYTGWDDIVAARETSKNWAVIWNRIEEAEKKYNFKFEFRKVGATQLRDDFIKNSMAGVFYTDIIQSQTKFAYPVFINSNFIIPVDDYYDFQSDPVWSGNQYFVNGLKWNGKYYGLTWACFGYGYGVIFNRELLQKEGMPEILDLVESNQWTWDTFLDLAQRATRDIDGDGVVDQYGLMGTNDKIAEGILYSNGARYLIEEGGRIKFGLTSPNAIRALQFMADLKNVYKVVGTPQGGFESGKALMIINGNSFLPGYRSKGLVDPGHAPVPMGPDVSTYQNTVGNNVNTFHFSSLAQDPKALVTIFAKIAAVWDTSRPDGMSPEEMTREAYKDRMSTQRDMDVLVKYALQPQFDRYGGFQDLGSTISKNILNPILDGTLPVASAVEATKIMAQDIIDRQMGY